MLAYTAYTEQIWYYNWVKYVLLQIHLVDKHCKRQLTKSCVYMPHWGQSAPTSQLPHNYYRAGMTLGLSTMDFKWTPPPQMTWQQHKSISIRAFNREFVDSENFKNCMDNRNYIRDVGGLFKQVRGGRLASRVAATNGWKASLLSYRFFSVFLFFFRLLSFSPRCGFQFFVVRAFSFIFRFV